MLKNGKWALKYDCCIECGTTEKRHRARGLCRKCFSNKEYKDFPEKNRAYKREEYHRNPRKHIERTQARFNSDPEAREKKRAYDKEYYKKHKVRISFYNKIWNSENKEKRSEYSTRASRKRRAESPQFKVRANVSTCIYARLKKRLSSKEGNSTWDFLPYTLDELVQHLEELFTEGMTWKNYGEWHIDHKRPDCSFSYTSTNDEEFKECWALKNLQPLWAVDNLKKGGKWDG